MFGEGLYGMLVGVFHIFVCNCPGLEHFGSTAVPVSPPNAGLRGGNFNISQWRSSQIHR